MKSSQNYLLRGFCLRDLIVTLTFLSRKRVRWWWWWWEISFPRKLLICLVRVSVYLLQVSKLYHVLYLYFSLKYQTQFISVEKNYQESCQFVVCGNLLMLYNVVNAIAIHVWVKVDCSVEHENEYHWPYLIKLFTDLYTMKFLLCLPRRRDSI